MTIGLESWFTNFSQFSYRASTPESLADIPRPYVEYSIWGMFKGAEIASVLGGLVAHPLYRWYLHRQLTPEKTTPNSSKIIRKACRRLQGRFLLFGLFSGPVVAAIHAQTFGDENALRNVCYSIRCDTPSLSMDRFVAMFGFVGWYWRRFQGAVDGINIAIAYALINEKIIAPRTSPILKDRVQPHERYATVEDAAHNKSQLKKFLSELEKERSLDTK
ncbi:unnamed protein product [Nippostrongylus brasiliensis]|uniref:Uncharacterized protein n=1 Tax=Nippostrongylus brasiliensis TaxID=27835 RepID=A0A0N4Y531_NIPBR|nr:hypothetical protein Q1695_002399 [Nippostrongylus brasiliensis]VDL74656.1 unnamed protein product [Nippostrongylus brasiliensis]